MRIAIIGTIAQSLLGFRIDLIRSLIANGHEVYAFATDYDDHTKKKIREIGAVPIPYQFSRAGVNPFNDIYSTFKLSKSLKKISPDLVFSYFAKPVIFGTLAAVAANVKRRIGMLEGLGYVFTEQPYGFSARNKLLQVIQVFLYKISFPFLERIIFLNPDDPKDLIQKYKLKVRIISILGPIGLNLDDYPYIKPSNPIVTFIFVGRLLAEKGINDYVSAARIVKVKYPDCKFVALGGLDEKTPGSLSVTDVDKLTQEKTLLYPGHVTNVVKWIADSSVFVLPSYYREGIPRSTQEAMAIGRPVITTDVPGCRETVIDGVNGFLVPKWSPHVLADRMIHFVENKHDIELMGIESNKLARQKYDSAIANQKLINYFYDPDAS